MIGRPLKDDFKREKKGRLISSLIGVKRRNDGIIVGKTGPLANIGRDCVFSRPRNYAAVPVGASKNTTII